MQTVSRDLLVNKAVALLNNGTVQIVVGWRKGLFDYDITPAVFRTEDDIKKNFEWNDHCGANLSKYLIKLTRKTEGKILVFLKPCDTYSFNQLLTEHRFDREKVYVVGVQCDGMLDDTDTELERCINCKSKKHVVYDELLGEEGEVLDSKRFEEVEWLESLTPDERFAFWKDQFSRCIRCNACRDVCPACSCEMCVFNNPNSGVENKAPVTSFEEQNFHIIRAFHVAGRCTDCGECSRVCPQHIPLHLLNRKHIKDINDFYGYYQAGEEVGQRAPLINHSPDDIEPYEIFNGGEKNV